MIETYGITFIHHKKGVISYAMILSYYILRDHMPNASGISVCTDGHTS